MPEIFGDNMDVLGMVPCILGTNDSVLPAVSMDDEASGRHCKGLPPWPFVAVAKKIITLKFQGVH